MATLEVRLQGLATAIGTDVKAIRTDIGTKASLTTSNKTNLVSSLNELHALITASTDVNDAALVSSTTQTYSVFKILELIAAAKESILGGISPEALDTISELAAFLTDGTVASGIVNQLANRVRVDAAQTFTVPQQVQARSNINAASATDLANLTSAIGNTDVDLVAAYIAAKA